MAGAAAILVLALIYVVPAVAAALTSLYASAATFTATFLTRTLGIWFVNYFYQLYQRGDILRLGTLCVLVGMVCTGQVFARVRRGVTRAGSRWNQERFLQVRCIEKTRRQSRPHRQRRSARANTRCSSSLKSFWESRSASRSTTTISGRRESRWWFMIRQRR